MRHIQANPPILQSETESDDEYVPALEIVQETLKGVIENAGGELDESFIKALSNVTRDLIEIVSKSGGDLEDAAESVILGAMRAAAGSDKDPSIVIHLVASAFIRKAAEYATNLDSAVHGLMKGASLGAKEFGIDEEAALSETATSVVDAAFEIDTRTGNRVTQALSKNETEPHTIHGQLYRVSDMESNEERVDTGSVD